MILKRILSVFLAVVLVISLLPASFANTVSAAQAGTFFIFPNEQYDVNSARLVNEDRVSLTGTLNGVNDKQISYSVFQLTKKADGTISIVNSNEGQTGNIIVNNGKITVSNIKLFSGLNRITFKGLQGTTQVEDSIYVEYRNGPTIYDLKANLVDGSQAIELKEDSPAVLTASPGSPAYGKTKTDISISGYAPSADKVTVEVNGRSWTYTVSSYNNYKFFASPINVNSGSNIVKIKVLNQNQTLETSREVTFYNGKVTFFDVRATDRTDVSADLSTFPNFNVSSTKITVKGKAIIPIKNGQLPDAAALSTYLGYAFANGASGSGTRPVTVLESANDYMMIEFSGVAPDKAQFDSLINVTLTAADGTTGAGISSTVGLTLRDKNNPFIQEVNYLSGYSSGMSPSQILNLSGTSMNGANIFSLPIAMEVLVANGASVNNITITGITDAKDNDLTPFSQPVVLASERVVRNINGNQVELQRIIIRVDKLPAAGYQKITFQANNVAGSELTVPVTLLYGPYVQFTSLYDDMKIEMDTNNPNLKDNVMKDVDYFKGQLMNVANDSEIKYSGTDQTIFLYINNTLVSLEKDPTSSEVSKFRIASGDENKAYQALFPGNNIIKFVFKSPKNSYEKSINISYVPLNVPVIPVPDSVGVFPYSIDNTDPVPDNNDKKFEKTGSVYTTTEKKMNVYGTFDFIDLGQTKSAVDSKLLTNSASNSKYMLKISTPTTDGKTQEYTWSMDQRFYALKSPGDVFNSSNGNTNPNLNVYYDYDTQTFSFKLLNQSLPLNGSPIVYNITVYNSGEGGPTATFRLEVTYKTAPFQIIRPLEGRRLVNQNFVEVIVSSDNASKVMIGKQEAKKSAFDADYDPSNGIDYPNAYRAIVKDLKPNKDNKIDITVFVGNDQLKDYITVKYVPTSIPGAQYLETMKSSHKAFDGNLTLTFPKGASLIRRDYNVADQFKNQVFSGHDILFAIANSEDGVVDRREFEVPVANFDNEIALGKQLFIGNFQQRFVKSSPVFWIDPGTADDINTDKVYDPITHGSDPYQLPGSEVRSFYNRESMNELVPSKRGTLTLTYDANITQDAGRLVTVFRFDPELQKWENIGGVVDPKKHTVKVPFDRFGYYVVAKLGYSYNDVVQHPYGRDYIETIYAKGVMNAFDPSERFGTDLYISRAEFVRAIVRALEIPLNYQGPKHFSDIPSSLTSINVDGLWDFRYIETAAREGITRGAQPQFFDAESAITRQDASVMIAKALNLKLETDRAKITKDLQKYFKDYASIDYYAQPSVLAIAKKGFIQGSPVDPADPKRGNMFNPTANMLRGDAAIIMGKVMADLKKLPKM